MVDTARRRARQRGVDNAEFRVIDAQRIPLADDEVDAVLCMNAYMVIPDVASALAETRRVLRPGGRLAMTVWGAPERNPWASVTSQILVDQGHIPRPDPEAPGITNLSDPAGTTALLGNAGFRDVETADVDIHFSFDSIEDFDRWVADVAGGLAPPVRELSATQRAGVPERAGVGVSALPHRPRLRGARHRPVRSRHVTSRRGPQVAVRPGRGQAPRMRRSLPARSRYSISDSLTGRVARWRQRGQP